MHKRIGFNAPIPKYVMIIGKLLVGMSACFAIIIDADYFVGVL